MKRTVLLLNALLLVGTFTGCSTNTTNSSSEYIPDVTAPATEPPVAATENTPTVIDVFDQAEITVNENAVYPNTVSIKIESTNPDVSSHIFSVDVTRADLKKIEYTISVNEEYDSFAHYLEQNNYVVAENSKSFVMETSELKTLLISDELLTDENVQRINDMAKEKRGEELLPIVSYAVVPNNGMTIDTFVESDADYIFSSNQSNPPEYYFYTIYQCDVGYYEVGAIPCFDEKQQLIVDETRFLNAGSYFQSQEDAQAAIDKMMGKAKNVDNTHVVTIEYNEEQPTT